MRQRCHNERDPSFRHYGGRGIAVCDRWRESFVAFLADMGPRPDGASLDRIDNDRGYEPGNCRWASRITQNRNRRNTRTLTVFGMTQPLAAWCEQAGLKYQPTWVRLFSKGQSPESVFADWSPWGEAFPT